MPFHREGPSRLIRLVQGRSGEVDMVTEFMLRFDYGLIVPPGSRGWTAKGCRRPPDRT
jgi:hypothetical protein